MDSVSTTRSTATSGGRATGGGPVEPTPGAIAAARPLPFAAVRITGGFWALRQQANRDVTIPAGWAHLHEAGNLENLRLAALGDAGGHRAEFRGPRFMDSDVYKWLEAISWEQGREPSTEFASWSAEAVAAVAAAQLPDGYVNSWVQAVVGAEGRWADLGWGHELYCAGHLMQAAVARARVTGQTDLADVAVRFADLLLDAFGADGPGGLDAVDGHPEVETALVELARLTGRPELTRLAATFVFARGRNLVDPTGIESAYFSDRVDVREATTVEGHAVRALYLQAGLADVAVETGDSDLLDRSVAVWEAMVGAKTYLTGGAGARSDGEAFGAPFELPPDRAYAETCAAQASVQWSWRLLLATGQARFADHIERTLFNAFAAGTAVTGDRFFYVNTLQLRGGSIPAGPWDPAAGRQRWFGCACCPPSIMRLLSSLHTYLATVDTTGSELTLQQYAPSQVRAALAGGEVLLRIDTGYPDDGVVSVTVVRAPAQPWTLALRVPGWAIGAALTVDGGAVDGVAVLPAPQPGDYVRLAGPGAGSVVRLTLPMPVRAVTADDRVDATRGAVALTRGPLVLCFEAVDQGGTEVDDLRLPVRVEPAPRPGAGALPVAPPSAGPGGIVRGAVVEADPGLLGGSFRVTVPARVRGSLEEIRAVAIPYALWANRRLGPMRVWVPTA